MILVFLMLSFKLAFSLFSFTFVKRLFSSSLLSAIKVVSSAYLRLLIFLSAILISACNSSSLVFCMMYSAYKLNKQGENIQPCHILLSFFFSVFYFIFIYFNWRLITLQYCSGFVILDINQPWVYIYFPSWPPPPLHPIPLGHPGAPALSTMSHVSSLDWRSVSHMIIYMFQCYSLKSSHPHLLPQSPKDCFIHLCLFCCLAYRVIVTIFLNCIYMH